MNTYAIRVEYGGADIDLDVTIIGPVKDDDKIFYKTMNRDIEPANGGYVRWFTVAPGETATSVDAYLMEYFGIDGLPKGYTWAEDSEGEQHLVKVVYCTHCGDEFASDEDVALHQQEGECPVSDQ